MQRMSHLWDNPNSTAANQLHTGPTRGSLFRPWQLRRLTEDRQLAKAPRRGSLRCIFARFGRCDNPGRRVTAQRFGLGARPRKQGSGLGDLVKTGGANQAESGPGMLGAKFRFQHPSCQSGSVCDFTIIFEFDNPREADGAPQV